MAAGYVYIMSNVSMPGILKIGYTTRPLEERVKDLSRATGVPTPFAVVFCLHVDFVDRAEREVHLRLATFRVSANREFFRVPLAEAIQAVKEIAKKYPTVSAPGATSPVGTTSTPATTPVPLSPAACFVSLAIVCGMILLCCGLISNITSSTNNSTPKEPVGSKSQLITSADKVIDPPVDMAERPVKMIEPLQPPTMFRGHTDTVETVVFSPDGKILASGGRDNSVRLWDVETGEEKSVLKEHTSSVYSLAFSPNGKTLASGDREGQIKLWDVSTGREERSIKMHGSVRFLAYSPDGKILAVMLYGGTIILYEVQTFVVKKTIEDTSRWHGGFLGGFTPDSKTLMAGYHGEVWQWDVASGEKRNKTKVGDVFTSILAISPDCTHVITQKEDKPRSLWNKTVLKIWDMRAGEEKATFSNRTGGWESATFSRDSKLFAARYGVKIMIWNVTTNEEEGNLAPSAHVGRSLTFSPDAKMLAGAGNNLAVLMRLSDMKQPDN